MNAQNDNLTVQSPLATTSSAATQALVSGDGVRLLVITDELGSSERRDPAVIRRRTAKHFACFLDLLVQPLCHADKTILVKNVGDSLMMRVEIPRSPAAVNELLQRILRSQHELKADTSTGRPIEIRVLVAMCDGEEIEGEDIHAPLIEELRAKGVDPMCPSFLPKLPGFRRGGDCWLWGDLFGVSVARAFRASGIPKGSELVVEDAVAKLADLALPELGGLAADLKFGPSVAFSPIKGMHDLYDVKRGRYDQTELRKHVYLRTVNYFRAAPSAAPADTVLPEDPLELRQQDVRVFTELVLDESEATIGQWRAVLKNIEHGANYFRFIGRVYEGATWSSQNHVLRKENSQTAGLIVLGAYPEFDTYFNVREGLLTNKDWLFTTYRMHYAVSNILWEARHLVRKKLWPHADPGISFVVLLGVASDIQDNPAHYTSSSWAKAMGGGPDSLSLPGFTLFDQGIVMGEWTYYAIFRAASTGLSYDWKGLAERCRSTMKGRHFKRVRFYGCQAI